MLSAMTVRQKYGHTNTSTHTQTTGTCLHDEISCKLIFLRGDVSNELHASLSIVPLFIYNMSEIIVAMCCPAGNPCDFVKFLCALSR